MAEAARAVDVLAVRRAFAPDDAERLNADYRHAAAAEMLADLLTNRTIGRVALVSSFGGEAGVLLHMLALIDRDVPVIFTDTGRMFAETLAYRDALAGELGLRDVRTVLPDALVVARRDEAGLRWSYDPDGCCALRKVEPLERALAGFDAWISGRKAFQAATRRDLRRFEVDGARLKINPLHDWSPAEVEAYLDRHALPRHPLQAQGYPSIGCEPCTSPVRPGEDARAGRWRGRDKLECGIHRRPAP